MEEIDFKELFSIFWNKKMQIILTVLIFATIGAIYTMKLVKPKYTSFTKLVLVQANNKENQESGESITTTDITLNSKLVSTYSELIKSKNVLRQVISNLNIDPELEEEIRKNIKVKSVSDTEVIEISVTDKDARLAARLANEIAKVFIIKVSEIYNINNVYIVDAAEISLEPSNINHIRDIVIFAFIGIIVAVVFIFIANMLDTTVKTAEDIEKKINIPVIASIPKYDSK